MPASTVTVTRAAASIHRDVGRGRPHGAVVTVRVSNSSARLQLGLCGLAQWGCAGGLARRPPMLRLALATAGPGRQCHQTVTVATVAWASWGGDKGPPHAAVTLTAGRDGAFEVPSHCTSRCAQGQSLMMKTRSFPLRVPLESRHGPRRVRDGTSGQLRARFIMFIRVRLAVTR